MISLITIPNALTKVAAGMRARRLEKGLTQEGLAERSGLKLPTLRKFEQKGQISLESFLKIALALGCLEEIVRATEQTAREYSSIDEVLKGDDEQKRRRGWRK